MAPNALLAKIISGNCRIDHLDKLENFFIAQQFPLENTEMESKVEYTTYTPHTNQVAWLKLETYKVVLGISIRNSDAIH